MLVATAAARPHYLTAHARLCPRQRPQCTNQQLLPLEVGAVAALPVGDGPATAPPGAGVVAPGAVAISLYGGSDVS